MLSYEFMKQVATRKKRQRLSKIQVLVVDQDVRIARLVQQVLESFGFQRIAIATSGDEASSVIGRGQTDLIISEWPVLLPSGEDFVKYVRTSPYSLRRDIPIILLTARTEQFEVERARDAGITEFLAKPFSAKTLSNRLIQVIDNPRSFILTPHYVGPDRRRQEADGATDERRTSREEMQKTAVVQGDGTIYSVNEQTVVVKRPNRQLKETIGSDLSAEKIFDPDNVRQAQQVIVDKKEEYKEWASLDIEQLESVYEMLKRDGTNQENWRTLLETSYSIEGQAGTFGYALATEVAQSLREYVSSKEKGDSTSLIVLRKHIDTLYVIFSDDVSHGSESTGRAVVNGLRDLVSKYTQ